MWFIYYSLYIIKLDGIDKKKGSLKVFLLRIVFLPVQNFGGEKLLNLAWPFTTVIAVYQCFTRPNFANIFLDKYT